MAVLSLASSYPEVFSMSLSKQYEALLSPVEIGGLALKNRVVMAPMGLDLALLHKSNPPAPVCR